MKLREFTLYLTIAWRNVLRNQRRSLLTVLGIVFGAIAVILFSGFVTGLVGDLRELTIHSRLGHIQLSRPGYREFGALDPVKYSLTNYRTIRDGIKTIPGVREVTKRLEYYGLLSNGEATVNFLATGVEADADARVNSYFHYRSGRAPTSADKASIAVGMGLATKMKLKVGDEVTLLVNYGGNSVNAVDATVVGVFQSGIEEFDGVAVTVPMRLTEILLGTSEDVAHTVVVTLDSTEMTAGVAAQIQSLIKAKGWDVEVKTWDTLATIYNKVVGLFDAIFLFLRLVVVTVVIFSVTNTITMSMFERFREIGSIRAIGTSRRGLATIFLMEGAVIGFLGGLIGVVGSTIPRVILNRLHILLPPPPVLTVPAKLFIEFEPRIMIEILIGSTVVSLLASYLPARRATRIEIISALRSV